MSMKDDLLTECRKGNHAVYGGKPEHCFICMGTEGPHLGSHANTAAEAAENGLQILRTVSSIRLPKLPVSDFQEAISRLSERMVTAQAREDEQRLRRIILAELLRMAHKHSRVGEHCSDMPDEVRDLVCEAFEWFGFHPPSLAALEGNAVPSFIRDPLCKPDCLVESLHVSRI